MGIVGFGKMGVLHAGIVNALPECSVTAVCEKDALITNVAKKLLRRTRFYTDVSEMMDNESLNAVFVTTPIQTHVAIIEDLLKSRNVNGLFSEKPLAADGIGASRIADAANRVVNIVGFQKRFSPVFQLGKRLLDGKALGDLQSVTCYSYSTDIFSKGVGWRFQKGSGGALLDLGPHLLDILLWYFGDPVRVLAIERSLYSAEVEDYVHAMVEFRSGLVSTLDISWSKRGYRLPEIRIEVQGTNGSMALSDDFVRIQVDEPVKGVAEEGARIFQKPSFNTNVDFLLADPEFTNEDKYFLTATMKNDKQAEPSFQSAARVNYFIDLMHSSARKRE